MATTLPPSPPLIQLLRKAAQWTGRGETSEVHHLMLSCAALGAASTFHANLDSKELEAYSLGTGLAQRKEAVLRAAKDR